jgi:acyl-CoA thioester hydrolase
MKSQNRKPAHCNITTGTISIRVRYGEVDRMNAVHHSQYTAYFEMGRTELLRDNGYDYRDLEDQGILLVIAKLEIRYKAPAQYDDELELTTKIAKIERVRRDKEKAKQK